MAFVTYRRFFDQYQVTALTEILNQHRIPFTVIEDRETLDALYGDKLFNTHFFVKIDSGDFETVDNLLITRSSQQLVNVDADHYLYTFTNNELYNVVAAADEWSEFDVLLAQKILRDKGEPLDEDTLRRLKTDRLTALSQPEVRGRGWIYVGYALSFLGGLLGIFIGWHLSTFKKTLPNGQMVYGFSEKDRAHGRIMLYIGVLVWGIILLERILEWTLHN